MRWHLTAAVLLASCGLDTSPETARKADESAAGKAAVAADDGEADSAARSDRFTWRPRKRFDPLMRSDATGSSSDAKDAATSAGATSPANATTTPQTSGPGQSGSSAPAANTAPASGPSSGGPKAPAAAAGATSVNTMQGPSLGMDAGTAASGTNTDASAPTDAAMSDPSPGEPDPTTSPAPGSSSGSSGSNGSNSGASGSPSAVTSLVTSIVDLVLAILDLSFGPVRPAEIEQLVSTILVLALAPADLVAESLTAVLTELEQTRICSDHPERCNPLCQNLESDCSVCGRDRACIDQIEHMCQVQLPDNCH